MGLSALDEQNERQIAKRITESYTKAVAVRSKAEEIMSNARFDVKPVAATYLPAFLRKNTKLTPAQATEQFKQKQDLYNAGIKTFNN